MNDLEIEFLEEYKRVESFCRDALSVQNGVTEYIMQMEGEATFGLSSIANWQNSYHTLKRLRWLRNQITHDTGASDCTEADLEALLSFHDDLLNQRDPLSQLYQVRKQESIQYNSHVGDSTILDEVEHLQTKDENKDFNYGLILVLPIIAIALIAYFTKGIV